MIIKKESPHEFKQLDLHDFYISKIFYDIQDNIYQICLTGGDFNNKVKRTIMSYNVLYFKHSHFQPWNAEDGPLIINICDIYSDIECAINQFNFVHRRQLCIQDKQIYKAAGSSIDISNYFLFSILLTSGDTIDILTDRIEVENVEHI